MRETQVRLLPGRSFPDADGDGYAGGPENALCAGLDQPENTILTSFGEDCDDTQSDLFKSVEAFVDSDLDGVGGILEETLCIGGGRRAAFRVCSDIGGLR